MIGAWSKFGTGAFPEDGEAIAFCVPYEVAQRMIDGMDVRTVVGVYRQGRITLDDGTTMPTPYGIHWTSLPPTSVKAYA